MIEYVTGIQQIGIGVESAEAAKHYYNALFGMNVLVFDDSGPASLMAKYTGNVIHQRQAVLTMNLAGGGGFELWQFLTKQPKPVQPAELGDIGIYAAKLKTACIKKAHRHFSGNKNIFTSHPEPTSQNSSTFIIADQYQNKFQIVESTSFFKKNRKPNAGVTGVVIGVTHLDHSIKFYECLLKPCTIHVREYYRSEPNGKKQFFRTAIIKKEKNKCGAFSNLLGEVEIELVQALSAPGRKLSDSRFWGDCGFIHLCFDVIDMDGLKQEMACKNYHFTVDSRQAFDMQNTAGRFGYIEDPDGTLIELVETHKIPIIKNIGWHLDLTKRKHNKPLPKVLVSLLGLNKIRRINKKM